MESYNIDLTHLFPPLRFRNQVPTFAVRETQSLGQQMLERWENGWGHAPRDVF